MFDNSILRFHSSLLAISRYQNCALSLYVQRITDLYIFWFFIPDPSILLLLVDTGSPLTIIWSSSMSGRLTYFHVIWPFIYSIQCDKNAISECNVKAMTAFKPLCTLLFSFALIFFPFMCRSNSKVPATKIILNVNVIMPYVVLLDVLNLPVPRGRCSRMICRVFCHIIFDSFCCLIN